MEKLKNYISDHKAEFGLLLIGSSLATYFLLKKNKIIPSLFVVPTQQRIEYSNQFLKNIQRTPKGSQDESEILGSIKVVEKNHVGRLISRLPPNAYINIQYLADLLEKSKVELVYDILYSHTTISTQTLSYRYFEDYNNPFIYIADTQIKGRGRKNNQWESPLGSLLTTFTSVVKTEDLVVMQYLVSLAIHEAILEKTGEKFILKWPNDTYYANEKIAGNMIQASDLVDNGAYKKIFIGFGVNVDNDYPTTSINHILEKNGKAHLTAEQLLVSILEKYQENLRILETDGWESGLSKRYFEYWEDYGIEAQFIKEGGNGQEKVKINGIDVMGNLILLKSNDERIAINPNYYSYDAIHKIFHPK